MTDKLGAGTLVCIPTFNERENIKAIAPAVLAQLPGANLLIIDDNSPDGTGQLADALSAEDERIFVLHRRGKEGLGKAYLAGFQWALDRDYVQVIEFDADFSHDPKYLPQMVNLLSNAAQVVVGSRRVKGGGTVNWGPLRKLISGAGSLYARVILNVPVNDLTGGFNGFRREALEALSLKTIQTSGYGFQIEIKYRAVKRGLTVVEMPIVFKDREAGESKMSLGIFIEAMLKVIQLRLK